MPSLFQPGGIEFFAAALVSAENMKEQESH